MVNQGLPPGVKDGEEADAGPQVLGIFGHGAKRAGGRPKEEAVDQTLVLKSELGQALRQSKDHVEVGDGEQAVELGLDESGPGCPGARG
jgi:hypothetical protein